MNNAKSWCVPTYETCLELNFPNDTNLYWYYSKKFEKPVLCEKPSDDLYGNYKARIVGKEAHIVSSSLDGFVKAPNLEQIAEYLPEALINYMGYESLEFCANRKVIGYGILKRFFWVVIHNNQYAEAYAKLYIELSKRGLLKEVQDA